MSATIRTITTAFPSKAGRYYSTETYLLPSDEVEKARLQAQHVVYKHYFGSELIPEDLELTEGDRILDAGTGSGSWASDVAQSVPEGVRVVGIDIERELLPSAGHNTEFLVQSSLDLPEEWTGKFVFIFQRLMVLAFTEDAWKKTIAGFYRALRPGGRVQLVEVDLLRVLYPEVITPPYTARWLEGVRQLCGLRGVKPQAIVQIPELLKEAGFVDIQIKISPRYTKGDTGKATRDTAIGSQRGLKGPFLKAGGFGIGRTDAEFDAYLDKVEEEWATTDFAWMWTRWTGRKPIQR
ncbi:S-adenosyl-L-methionine-dependent methyltransferase [Dacryopinax primogenitus]|uniref:S-adenosyl-L-methionine-dependent methyltransferase n=1 Tax=Dacryopinax primogenitus (strain DJM 731) TaxID=1858805 RepID=M5GFR1_DACPD|nr:S-adenosyl-L-methionine-dependent methyltransferase [Dacryopinax primogenitus]EJU06522.1 S-adenosyl-L-methionine-dependent methyltransferase [Dacryopinax primogenitus]